MLLCNDPSKDKICIWSLGFPQIFCGIRVSYFVLNFMYKAAPFGLFIIQGHLASFCVFVFHHWSYQKKIKKAAPVGVQKKLCTYFSFGFVFFEYFFRKLLKQRACYFFHNGRYCKCISKADDKIYLGSVLLGTRPLKCWFGTFSKNYNLLYLVVNFIQLRWSSRHGFW